MNIGIYVRVACRQRDSSAVDAQKESLERYCTRHGLTVTRRYCDDGVSGLLSMDQRPAGRRLLRDARLSRFDQLLVAAPDRLGRDVRVVLKAVAQLQECGVLVRTMAEGLSEAIAGAQSSQGSCLLSPQRTLKARCEQSPAKAVGEVEGSAMAVGVYFRVSTEEQCERQSIATQKDFAERFSRFSMTVVGSGGACCRRLWPAAPARISERRASACT